MITDTADGIDGEKYDSVVVGAGPAGLSFAIEMAQHGKSVLVIESGGVRADPVQQDLSAAEIINPQKHNDMEIAVSRQLGGTSNLWAGSCVPFDPIDFSSRPHINNASWPIGFEDIVPFYEPAISYLSGGRNKFCDPLTDIEIEDSDFSFDQLERYSNRPAIQHQHKELLRDSTNIEIRIRTTLVDIEFDENGDVAALLLVRPDGSELRVAVKNLVLACGGLETARQLLVAQRKHPGMFGGPAGPLGKFYMGHVTGEISNIIFENNKLEEGLSFYLDEDGTYIRRRLVPSPLVQSKHELSNIVFWPVVPPIFDASHRSGILSLLFLTMATEPIGRRLIAEVIRQKHVPADINKWPHIENVLRELPRSARVGLSLLYKRYLAASRLPGFFLLNANHRYGLSYHAEQLPNESSRVFLNGASDKLGMPRLSIDYKFSEDDALPILRAHELLGAWLEKNGLGRIEYRQQKTETIERILAIASHGTHQIGLARMGECRKSGVVDRNLCSFDSRNLYLLSSAVFPSSGQCNPTLSIVALAVRLAEHLSNGEIIE